MNEDCLKLTTYFGERDRMSDGLLADALLDLYEAHGVRSSALFRGIEGFGRLHHLHTDRLLTLSEDLPVVSVAVDTRQRIEALIEPVRQIQRRGLITLERARMLAGEIEPVELPEQLHEETKLTVYVGRRERAGRVPAFVALTDLLHRRQIAGATALLGVDGTRDGRRFRARLVGRNADVPMMIIAVGSGDRIAQALPELGRLLQRPLVTLERVRVCKRDGQTLARPQELPAVDGQGLPVWQKLMLYTSQAHMEEGSPVNLQIVRRLREANAAGATCIRGIWGFHGDHAPHGERLLRLRRHVPVVTIAIDTPERIAEAFAIIDPLTDRYGLLTSEMVPAMVAMSASERRGGLQLAERDPHG